MKRSFSAILPVAALLAVASLPAFGQGTPTRAFRQAFPLQGTADLRLANLAGRVELVRIQGNQLVVDATVHAQGDSGNETQKLLQGMKWVRAEDRHGKHDDSASWVRYRQDNNRIAMKHSSSVACRFLELYALILGAVVV